MRSEPAAAVFAWVSAHPRATLYTTSVSEAEIRGLLPHPNQPLEGAVKRKSSTHPTPRRSPEEVDNAEAGLLEIAAVSCDDRQAVNQSRRSDQAVFDRHSVPGGAKICDELRSCRLTWLSIFARI